MAPHAFLRACAVTGQHRPQQLDVLLDRFPYAHPVIEHEVPESQAEMEVPLERVLEKRVARGSIDLAVYLLVELHELARVRKLHALEPLEQFGDGPVVVGAASLGGEPSGVAF